MKRTISLWLGLLAFALVPVLAQAPEAPAIKGPTGSIHGTITGPEGAPRTSGSVSLSTDDGHTYKFTFPVSSSGSYAGTAAAGTYKVVYRAPDTAPGQFVDFFDKVKIVAGQDVLQDFDMSRKEYVEKLSADVQKQLVELRKHNAEAMKDQGVVKNIVSDLKICDQDFKDAHNAHDTAKVALGPTAKREDIEAKEAEIVTAKNTEVETLMQKDLLIKPGESVLWLRLGEAQLGLKKYADAETAYKKALEVEAAAKKPMPQNQGFANAGLGELYARTGKIPEAQAAYDAAAKADPTRAAFFLTNEAVIFSQVGNNVAQAAAADEAIKADPNQALPYYLKGQALIVNATPSPKPNLYIPPPGCAEAYAKYLQLAPNGPHAAEIKGIMTSFYVK
jgi:tetratricopeptide (TPR) repeat protein